MSVRSIEPVASRPVRCIKVDSPDGLFLAGRGLVATHNTGVFKMAALAWLYLLDEPLVAWSAHEFPTVEETMRDLEDMILNCDMLRKKTARIVHANGSESIETLDGSRVIFRTRTKTGGRGLSANKIIFDEAFALHGMHMGALLPTMSAKPDPQMLFGSSAGFADSDVEQELVARGRPGDERDWVTDQPLHQVVTGPLATGYLEWCAPPPAIACAAGDNCTHAKTAVGCGCDKYEYVSRANPTEGIRITREYLIAERRTLPSGEFPRERMGWHETPAEGSTPMPMSFWYRCSDRYSTPSLSSPLALAVAVTHDSSMTAIGLAGWRDDKLPHGELVEHLPGTAWLIEQLLGIVERRNPCVVVLDPSSPAGAFVKQLKNAGFITMPKDKPGAVFVPDGKHLLMLVTSQEYAQGCGMLVNAVTEDQFRHPDQKPLNDAARAGRSRPVARAWAWDSPQGKDISPLEAVTLAHSGLATYGARPALTPFALT